jgi:anti-sigma regulatory factor (Ser/Thr protein kinase)
MEVQLLARIRDLPPDPTSVPRARHAVGEAAAVCSDDVREDAQMCVSELATNCVLHAHTPFDVVVELDEAALRVAVADHSHKQVRVSGMDWNEASGRGLAIVAALADRWGHRETSWGEVVWFEINLRSGDRRWAA